MNYKAALQANNIDLCAILTSINELPSADSGGVELPTLTNEGSASDMLAGKQLIDSQGQVVTGTIETKTESDLNVEGATISASAGYYASSVSKSVATATQAVPSINVSSNGLITASVTQETGYVNGDTKSVTQQLTVQEAKVVTPTKSEQTAVNSNVYTTGNIVVAAISDDYIATSEIEGSVNIIKNKLIDFNVISNNDAEIDECATAINNIANLGAINYTFDSEIATNQTIPAGYTSGGNIIITQITHCYYDGLRLPKPPADSIAVYPYCWIRDNEEAGNYDLIMGTTRFFYDASGARLKHVGSDTDLWYRIPKSTAANATSWGSPVGHSYVGWGLGSDRTVFWANHDVTNGENSSSIYIYGSDPVPEISGQEFLNMVEEVL